MKTHGYQVCFGLLLEVTVVSRKVSFEVLDKFTLDTVYVLGYHTVIIIIQYHTVIR